MVCHWVRMRDSCDPGGVSDGPRLVISNSLYGCKCVCTMHMFCFMGSLRVSVPYLFLHFLLCSCFFIPFSLSLLPCSLFLMLSSELFQYFPDFFLSSRPRFGLATAYVTGYVWLNNIRKGKWYLCVVCVCIC